MTPYVEKPDEQLPTSADYNRLDHFRRRHIEPPTFEYVTVDDTILVEGFGAQSQTILEISVRMLNPNGEIIPYFQSFPFQALGGNPSTFTFKNMEGFLLSMSIRQPAGQKATCFVRATLQRGAGSNDTTRGKLLISGYPSVMDTLGYPWGTLSSSLDGRAALFVQTPANPAAGAQFSISVPPANNWILRSMRFQLITSAAVANRSVVLRIDDGNNNVFADIPAGPVQAASLNITYTLAPGLILQAVGAFVSAGLPQEFRLAQSWRIRSITANMDVADQFSGIGLDTEVFCAV